MKIIGLFTYYILISFLTVAINHLIPAPVQINRILKYIKSIAYIVDRVRHLVVCHCLNGIIKLNITSQLICKTIPSQLCPNTSLSFLQHPYFINLKALMTHLISKSRRYICHIKKSCCVIAKRFHIDKKRHLTAQNLVEVQASRMNNR